MAPISEQGYLRWLIPSKRSGTQTKAMLNISKTEKTCHFQKTVAGLKPLWLGADFTSRFFFCWIGLGRHLVNFQFVEESYLAR